MEVGISCLRCYSDNQISYKSSAWQKDCDYLRPLNGPSSVGDTETYDISVSPNPFNTNIKLSIARQFELYDSFGRLIQKGNTDEINTESISEGIFVKIDN